MFNVNIYPLKKEGDLQKSPLLYTSFFLLFQIESEFSTLTSSFFMGLSFFMALANGT